MVMIGSPQPIDSRNVNPRPSHLEGSTATSDSWYIRTSSSRGTVPWRMVMLPWRSTPSPCWVCTSSSALERLAARKASITASVPRRAWRPPHPAG